MEESEEIWKGMKNGESNWIEVKGNERRRKINKSDEERRIEKENIV